MNYLSYIFTPGTRPERFDKGLAAGAYAVVLDWEDGVGDVPAEKKKARTAVSKYLKKTNKMPEKGVGIRVNAIDSNEILNDISAIVQNDLRPDFILIPKVESARDIEILSNWLDKDFSQIPFIALIETIQGMENVESIAVSDPRVLGLGFGLGDLSTELGIEPTSWEGLFYHRSRLITAAKKALILAIDGPYLDIDNKRGLTETCVKSKALGFNAMFAIHPSHLEKINSTFFPCEKEIKHAKKVVDAFEQAEHRACKVDGQMIDKAVIKRMRQILYISEKR